MSLTRIVILLPLIALVSIIPLLNLIAQPQNPTKPKGTNYAFLVACGEYDINELRKLPFAMKETEEFHQVLIATGYEEKNIKFLHDGQAGEKGEGRRYLPEKKKIVAEFELLMSRVTSDDTVLVLLNGHGVHFRGDKTGYFCPVDAKLGDKETLWAMDGPGSMFDKLKDCKAKRKLLLVNACRNDPASDRSLSGDKIKLDDEDKDEVPEGIAAFYSCKPGQKSYYYDPTNSKTKGRERSLFMHHLIESWGKGGKVTIEEVFKSVRDNAAADADALFGRTQTPVVRREFKGEGEWVIARDLGSVREPKPGEEREFEIAQGVKMVFCWIPAGECQLGSHQAERDEVLKGLDKFATGGKTPEWLASEAWSVRGKYMTKGFWLGKYPVTQGEWEAVMGNNPSWFRSGGGGKEKLKKDNITDTSRFPVERVNWYDCQKFLTKINEPGGGAKMFGKTVKFMLPDDNQWEYACRAGNGNDRTFYWGNELNGTQANCWGERPFGTTTIGPYLGRTCAVEFSNDGKYEKHPWGLMHMLGNVYQWCDNKYGASNDRVVRGGSWGIAASACRSAARDRSSPDKSPGYYGFRVCIRLD
jgi:formylglycine-generating enzyme required for sulfatase activity